MLVLRCTCYVCITVPASQTGVSLAILAGDGLFGYKTLLMSGNSSLSKTRVKIEVTFGLLKAHLSYLLA